MAEVHNIFQIELLKKCRHVICHVAVVQLVDRCAETVPSRIYSINSEVPAEQPHRVLKLIMVYTISVYQHKRPALTTLLIVHFDSIHVDLHIQPPCNNS